MGRPVETSFDRYELAVLHAKMLGMDWLAVKIRAHEARVKRTNTVYSQRLHRPWQSVVGGRS